MTFHTADFAATATAAALATDTPALTSTAKLAMEINDKHRKVVTLGRTAKETAAEIGEMLIEVKQGLAHGEFMPWVEVNCSFKDRAANNYMKIAKTKIAQPCEFARCESIADVLALGKPKPSASEETKPERRAATLDDLRKVERLRALRDDPACTESERAACQRKLDEIEKEIGKVDPDAPKTKDKAFAQTNAEKITDILLTRKFDNVDPIVRNSIIKALVHTYGDHPQRLRNFLKALG
ncbi:DUF3102 domain-containing protein [Ruegeria sp. WL0004]|uniref:DUF3102 domain-containing protein n=1 Tax=Ruegeria marisflavi TaxID=2984152 RepID=A0ABT2WUU0_9RHOB|nr:DUF3102 domain-containing protein [Ruegeria sp. WL0004]MCU9839674.1 DUF3102 domain-containing protein [Ruegeria sp. WL0004]